jgi:hypothetical protein
MREREGGEIIKKPLDLYPISWFEVWGLIQAFGNIGVYILVSYTS